MAKPLIITGTKSKYPRNRGATWYKTAQGPSRWRYTSVFHILHNDNEDETWCGLLRTQAANAYTEEDIVRFGVDYMTTRRTRLCKKCERHPNYGLILLGKI